MTQDSIDQFVDVIFKLKNRVDNIEASRFREAKPNVLRSTSDESSSADSIAVTIGADGAGEWNTDDWDFAEWV